ncbi:MAG: PEP-utilizing enzyme [Candidatus Omnitrophica bacterium]|nr:PEP-utilizing enzyme [Candidatus Omnitrophota bacterium]MDD5774341.1 PEP-utilizing enzyme [Candidatus Omnitrophota bacterium]
MVRNQKKYSKAETLQWLKPRLRNSFIEDLFVFTVDEWNKKEGDILDKACSLFSSGRLIVRSSSRSEDHEARSGAGCFHSESDIPVSRNAVRTAVHKVIESYKKMNADNRDDQVFIQPYTKHILMSGVVFTRQIETNAPYYVINYDERSGKTDTVTAGRDGTIEYISHFAEIPVDSRWRRLIKAVREIESLFRDQILDIEFAITARQGVVIFQVRPLAANYRLPVPDNTFVKHLLKDMTKKFRRFSQREPHLAGGSTVFGDMPDWNPSEIIGGRPNTLDYSIYSFIVTDEVWHEARSSLGYYDVYPAELMVSFGKKPYIDARASFNSFTPADIPFELREKLLHYYLDKLKAHPELQDKVEFEVLWTCYDFSTSEKVRDLKKHGFSQKETAAFLGSLKELTNNILRKFAEITDYDLKQVYYLTDRRNRIMDFYNRQEKTPWNSFYTAYNILQNCKRFGTFPFSRQARLAFIAKNFLISMKDRGFITDEFYHEFLGSIRTVASKLNDDFYRLQKGSLLKEDFIRDYGHLRAGTYDITSLRYDSSPDLFSARCPARVTRRSQTHFTMTAAMLRELSRLMKENGLHGDGSDIIAMMRSAIENREYTKFEFTRSLSDALELIAEAGRMLGFGRDEICHADFPTIMKFRNPEHGDLRYAKKIIRQSIDRHRKEREWYDAIILPPVIAREQDFYFVKPYDAAPNFITRKSVEGAVMTFDEIKRAGSENIKRSILLLENADPGFDWIFTRTPRGIITKYGGVASHMSIRCAEFGIPAAIGCGEVIYNSLKKARNVKLDCIKRIVKPLLHY